MKEDFQSFLGESIERFLRHKRALGCRYLAEESALRLFDRYLAGQHLSTLAALTPAMLEAFLDSRPRQRARSYNHLRGTLARLLTWLLGQGLLEKSPLRTRPRKEATPRQPFIFDRTAVGVLLKAAAALPDCPGAPQRALTYRTIFALLYGLGLRVGEVSRLTIGDLDFQRRLLVIRETKFYKSRLIPFGPRMEELLRDFLRSRAATAQTSAAPLFSFRQGKPIRPETISQTFHALVPQLQLSIPPGTAAPRLHDLRHSFAVGTLLRWYRSGVDPQAGLLRLSTFLGHVDPASTAVYLSISEPLLEEANRRFEAFAQALLRQEVLP